MQRRRGTTPARKLSSLFYFLRQHFSLSGYIPVERMVKTVETALPRSDKETEEIYPRNGDTVYRVCFPL